MLICPVCGEKLEKNERKYLCKNNHNFDISKWGHTNLLLSNQKNSKIPGDNKEMVKSRKMFLEADYYKEISLVVNKTIEKLVKDKKEIKVLDIGCGEGYYTNNLKLYLEEKGIKTTIYGIDISKEAIIAAAKQHKNIEWIVASASSLPLEDESIDIILCMFAKIIPEEKMRVLKKDGKFLVVSTGENHLLQLKEVVYDKVRKEYYEPEKDLEMFSHLEKINMKSKIKVKENENIKNLFNMTPYRWRSPQKGIEKLFELKELETEIEVNIDVFEKR